MKIKARFRINLHRTNAAISLSPNRYLNWSTQKETAHVLDTIKLSALQPYFTLMERSPCYRCSIWALFFKSDREKNSSRRKVKGYRKNIVCDIAHENQMNFPNWSGQWWEVSCGALRTEKFNRIIYVQK